MCECTLLADGVYTPIHIASDTMQFVYIDKRGNRHVLIKKFSMTITTSKASVSEIKRDGLIVGYQFNVEQ